MSRLDRIGLVVVVIGIVCFSLAIYEYHSELTTTKSWQTRAWDNYDKAQAEIAAGATNVVPSQPEEWWSQNPFFVSLSVWVSLLKNWLYTIGSILSGLYHFYLHIRRKRLLTAKLLSLG